MFDPKFIVTQKLLANIKRVGQLEIELSFKRFPDVVLMEAMRSARELSAHASTSIEGNPLPLTEVKEIIKNRPENLRDSEREVLNYNDALVALNSKIRDKSVKLSPGLILDIHKQVTEGLLPKNEVGKWRKLPVVVNDPRTRQIAYLPPDWTEVPRLMEELIAYTREQQGKIDPLILAGILHKQMVIIHPFMDGNGRTTRLTTKVMLAASGLDTFNLFSFENYYNNNVTLYFRTVGEYGDYNELVTKMDFTMWLEYFTDGIIDELLRVSQLLVGQEKKGKQLSAQARAIINYIDHNGSINEQEYAGWTDRAKATRALDLKKLVEEGLIERKGGGRSTYYVKKV